MSVARRPLEERLEGAFGRAEPRHFEWQTAHPIVGREEAALVQRAFLPLGERVLDVGCAEGATLFHLGDPYGAIGVDLFEPKLVFARSVVKNAIFMQGSIYELPFPKGQFDHVIVRDVIHHLDEPERAITELARVLSPDGRIDILEPCRNNPLILLHALVRREERGELRSNAHFLRWLLEPEFELTTIERYQPLPLHRLFFHPGLGKRALTPKGTASNVLGSIERALERVMPRPLWAYVHARATLRPGTR